MDRTVFVILLLTGFCVVSTSFPNVYYFIRDKMTWWDAQLHCILKYTSTAQILHQENVTEMMNTPTGGYTDKAWIGLLGNISEWTTVDGQPATYFNWGIGQPKYVTPNEACVAMVQGGYWNVDKCSEKNQYVCHGGGTGTGYFVGEQLMNWNDARLKCYDKGSVLATISNSSINSNIEESVSNKNEAWIGLSRSMIWNWLGLSESKNYTFTNWQSGQPDYTSLEWGMRCGAVMLTDGTWMDEQCNATYPFFCYGIYKSRKTVVRMKIESSANMEDPVWNAKVLRQLRAAVSNQGVFDFKLTWNKLPEKQESNEDEKGPC